ncbi:hypothetical protein A6A08_14290 [Nocardiopsis sp. TSRI0078]|uniref:hypothetical protein n=1 Tax=unclassified Nocardiopsis TaxID=2649073 RepID=UPI00093A851E|nr:hypothetical protein [Nocardiopsis sp. TSRI0078]OKI13737.1 hypothetical protein A6A08_14290 [Nocardiopsis sp. TSRI0078]
MSAATPPLPDYDDLSVGQLRERVRSLPAEQVRALIGYEESHADRMEVLELLKDRLDGLTEGDEIPGGPGPEDGPDPEDDACADVAPDRRTERS